MWPVLLILLAACPKTTPPSLYPLDVPVLDAPEPLDYPRAPDTCDGPVAVLTGERVTFADARGNATCGGMLLGDDQFAAYVHDADVALPWYQTFAEECAAGRVRDRTWADAAYQRELGIAVDLERDNRALRLSQPVAFGVGLLVGAGVVVTATSIEVSIAR